MSPSAFSSRLSHLRVGVVGATGAVGRKLLEILEQRWGPQGFEVGQLTCFGSSRSEGKVLSLMGGATQVKVLDGRVDPTQFDLVFFTASSSVAREFAPAFAEAGVVVVDNSSFFRMSPEVPLVVPEINGMELGHALARKQFLFANPNCTTALLVMTLKPLHELFGLKRVVVSSYQAVSGRGQTGIEEFTSQRISFEAGAPLVSRAFAHPIVYDSLPHIDVFQSDGFTGEERKVMTETRKILGLPNLPVVATCVRVPVINGHSESVVVECDRPVDLEQLRDAWKNFPGLLVLDDPSRAVYPLAQLASGKDDVLVGRLRRDPSVSSGVAYWLAGDNLRKGAALNAVQIAELAEKLVASA